MAKLFIVGTPIGNLSDMTFRAVETLKMVDIIACEDTRHSLALLNHYCIHTKLMSYHNFNEIECSDRIISLICEGKNVALITDAGMPSISDPGAEVVSKCHEVNIAVELVPGPTAVASAIALSGIKSNGFTFLGFLPDKMNDKVAVLSKVLGSGLPIVIYVAPHDMTKTAAQLFEILGDRKVYVARELTKIHESVTHTTLSNFACEERGEMVAIIEGKAFDNPLNTLSVHDHLRHYIELGVDKKDAVKKVATDRGLPKNEVYQQALNMKNA